MSKMNTPAVELVRFRSDDLIATSGAITCTLRYFNDDEAGNAEGRVNGGNWLKLNGAGKGVFYDQLKDAGIQYDPMLIEFDYGESSQSLEALISVEGWGIPCDYTYKWYDNDKKFHIQ